MARRTRAGTLVEIVVGTAILVVAFFTIIKLARVAATAAARRYIQLDITLGNKRISGATCAQLWACSALWRAKQIGPTRNSRG